MSQFLYGAIGGEEAINNQSEELGFNSYMVRLVAKLCCFYLPILHVSIPIWCDWWKATRLRWLVFFNVSIPIWCDWWSCNAIRNYKGRIGFNSYMVRLVVRNRDRHSSQSSVFQFLYGAIGGIY